MEHQNVPIMAKKIWSIVRVVYLMLRKGISKKKLLLDLNIMLKRGKIARKALANLVSTFHHHHHHNRDAAHHLAYEFSCSNSPAFPALFHLHTNKRRHHQNHLDDLRTVNAVLEMLNSNDAALPVEASPGFGRSPMVRQLRITDSPFPLKEVDEDSNMVDKAAEDFIQKFYTELMHQKTTTSSSPLIK